MDEMRDDFSAEVKRVLADRVGYHCSNPDCGALTTGPREDPDKAVNLGVASHITAASPGGPRYNQALSPRERRQGDNGIWLCQNCAKLVDNDHVRFSELLLRAWKIVAEDRARTFLGKTTPLQTSRLGALPSLDLFLEPQGISGYTYSPNIPVRWFVLGLRNIEGGTARFPRVSFRRSLGLSVDNFGIDGNSGFGLPQTPSDGESITFRGGVDNVIHAGETLKITKLWQNGEKQVANGRSEPNSLVRFAPRSTVWVFKAISFQCEVSCEGIGTVAIERSVPADSVDWPIV